MRARSGPQKWRWRSAGDAAGAGQKEAIARNSAEIMKQSTEKNHGVRRIQGVHDGVGIAPIHRPDIGFARDCVRISAKNCKAGLRIAFAKPSKRGFQKRLVTAIGETEEAA